MQVRKALTFRASAIGDALNAKYLLENIHAAYPEARCGLVVAGRGAMIRDLLAAYPWIEVIEANRHNLRSLWRLWRDFHASDIVITPNAKPGGQFALPSKLAARLLARRGGLIGFADAWHWNRRVYDTLLPSDAARAPRLLEQDALRAAHIPVSVETMTLQHLPQPQLLARLGLEGKKYLVVHLFAGSANRAISNDKRQQLLDALVRVLPHTPLLLTGSQGERAYIEQLRLPPTAQIVAGDLSVQELAALIDACACMVSIGTGPSHMASHLGKPLLVLVVCIGVHWCGPEQFGRAAGTIFSYTEACKDGHDFSNPFAGCIEGVDVEAVARAAAEYAA